MDYTKYIEKLRRRKVKFANEISCYGPGINKWGKIYGYDLHPPFSLERYEALQDKELYPEDLKNYLLNITSEIFQSSYPVNTDGLGSWIFVKECSSSNCSRDEEDPDENNPNWKPCCGCEYVYGLYIGCGGCSFSNCLILKSNSQNIKTGHVYFHDCDFDNFKLLSTTFGEYVGMPRI